MARKVRTTLLYVVVPIVFFASVYYYYLGSSIPFSVNPQDINTVEEENLPSFNTPSNNNININIDINNIILQGNLSITNGKKQKHKLNPDVIPGSPFSTVSVLLPDWEILVIVSPEDTPPLVNSLTGHENDFLCVHYTEEVTPAKLSGNLSFPDRVTFRCLLPERARKRLPFKQPSLRMLPDESPDIFVQSQILLIWSNLVYDTLTPQDDHDDDLVVFAKGLIKKQDTVRDPSEFECIFGDDVVNGVTTPVKTSTLEVFRCGRPSLTDFPPNSTAIKVSLRILTEQRVVPSVAYYTPTPRKLASTENKKALLCACTMVYNVAKFLKEWVYYHSRIGVEKFILYDNGSDDDLVSIVSELNQQGYDVNTYFWLWQKTQEAGFSHSALYARESCKWMMYVDVDEFVYSPKWSNSSTPSISMLQHLMNEHGKDNKGRHNLFEHSRTLDTSTSSLKVNLSAAGTAVGQISIGCLEFGPSDQSIHPLMGVTQGYNCRMVSQNRHKSIVLLEAVDDCLSNVIHHFKLKHEYRSVLLSIRKIRVNHYKYQAWPEFKAKFKRRVSAYVVDWNSQFNLNSQDRPKGLKASSAGTEPKNWTKRYCQVHDNRLRDLVRRWFLTESSLGYRMPWQI